MKRSFFKFNVYFFCRDPSHSNIYFTMNPVKENHVNFVKFRNDGVVTGFDPHRDAFKFWDEMFVKYKKLFYKLKADAVFAEVKDEQNC